MTPQKAFDKARVEGPSDLTRNAVLSDPWCALMYAKYVDVCPRDDTRKSALRDTQCAYIYARDIDKCWRVDTWKVDISSTKANKPFEYSPEWLSLGDIPATMVLT